MSADALERLVLVGVVVAVGLVILTISVIALPPLNQLQPLPGEDARERPTQELAERPGGQAVADVKDGGPPTQEQNADGRPNQNAEQPISAAVHPVSGPKKQHQKKNHQKEADRAGGPRAPRSAIRPERRDAQ